jgi:hypothetical protein
MRDRIRGQFGDPRYVLILDHSAFVLSQRDAVRAIEKTIPYHVPGSISDRQRELAHEAWMHRDAADRQLDANTAKAVASNGDGPKATPRPHQQRI